MIEVKKREGENFNTLFFRFRKKIKQQGILKEVKKRKFRERPQNKRKKLLAALYRVKKAEELRRLKKIGAV